MPSPVHPSIGLPGVSKGYELPTLLQCPAGTLSPAPEKQAEAPGQPEKISHPPPAGQHPASPSRCGPESRLAHLLRKHFAEPPSAQSFAFNVFEHYVEMSAAIAVAIDAYLSDMHSLLFVTLFGLILPPLCHAINTYFVLSIVKNEMPEREKLYESFFAALNLNRLREARRFLKGQAPIWSLHFKDRLGNLTLCAIPSCIISLSTLMRNVGDFNRGLVVFELIFVFVMSATQVQVVHTCHGPPGNMQKYRVWGIKTGEDSLPSDGAGKLLCHALSAFLIDVSQVAYRLLLLTLLTVFCGWSATVAVLGVYAIVTTLLVRIGLSLVPAYLGYVDIMSCITGLETALYDYCWLEPVPVYSFYSEAHFPLRALQAMVMVWLIHLNWTDAAVADLDEDVLGLTVGLAAVFSALYFALYPVYMYGVNRHRWRESKTRRDEFLATMYKKRVERLQSKI
ncbi:unnamed protein product [Amoebophrya sp. A120]|nr:unnamed protein product [Amoebophrya sp. A120]|eukprot:GSA120T00004922001.1